MAIASVDVETRPAAMSVRWRSPTLRVTRTEPAVAVERREPQVRWDRSDYLDAVNARPSAALGRALRDQARAEALRAIAQIAQEGDALGRVEQGNMIETVARGKLRQDERGLTLAAVPRPVRTTVDPGGLDLRVRPGELRIEALLAPVAIEVQRYIVTVDTEVPSQVSVHA
ncbi:MAG: hypothetical protein K2X91_16730 [Thermoleophilia bacterium]|jgi:hypothetical protein|nr:hypothetical protein [Thermoleophilia bacterium]